jgi:hypothetical protein
MEQWALILADSVLLVVALGGAVLTLVRARRVGGAAAALAGAACGVLVLAAIFDMVWWTQVYPSVFDPGDSIATAANLSKIGTLGTTLLISIGVALLIVSTNIRRSVEATPAQAPAGLQPPFPAGAQPPPPAYQIPQQHTPQQHTPQPAPQPAPQAAAGWTPPQQQPGQPDWNIHSGVWSIPRGTFDGPPPDQRQR